MNMNVTACHGAQGVSCTQYNLYCSVGSVIDITAGSYGYRQGCSTGIGAANCEPNSTRCCTEEETGDCFISFNQTQLSQLQNKCRGRTCSVHGYKIQEGNCYNNKNNNLIRFSSYSKIDYTCINTDSPSSPRTTTSTASRSTETSASSPSTFSVTSSLHPGSVSTSPLILPSTRTSTFPGGDGGTAADQETDVGGIVGGIISVSLVAVLVAIAVIFFLKRKKGKGGGIKSLFTNKNKDTTTTIPSTPSPHYFTVEPGMSLPTTAPLAYTEVDLKIPTKSATNAMDNYNHFQLNHPVVQSSNEDDYDHIGGDNPTKQHRSTNNYDLIGSKFTSDDEYQHLGADNSKRTTPILDTYNTVGSFGKLDEGEYHHLGDSGKPKLVIDDEYHQIGDVNHDVSLDDNGHLGDNITRPSNLEEGHIYDENDKPGRKRFDYSTESEGGSYSVAKDIDV